MKKTLIFCFDGTCNDPEDVGDYAEDGSITNILKLHILFGGNLRDESNNPTDGGLPKQSFYYKGVGTYGGKLRRFLNMSLAPENADVKSILGAATENLVEHYEKGDHVLVFGFSRGAALARRFASVAKERLEKKKPKKTGLEIDFLGVFDTVAAISSPSRGIGNDLSVGTKPASDVVFENGKMSENVQKAVHLVALDENRIVFQPTLFDYDSDRITEVWFPGVHSDVGGGYSYDGLSDLALEYMIKKMEQVCGGYVQIHDSETIDYEQLNDKDDTQITKDDINRKALCDGILHEHKRPTTSITTVKTAGIITGVVTAVTAGVVTAAATAITTSGAIVIAAGVALGIIATIAAIGFAGLKTIVATTVKASTVADARVGVIIGLLAGLLVGLLVAIAVGAIVYMLTGVATTVITAVTFFVAVGVTVGVIVGRKFGGKTLKMLHPRKVRIAGKHPDHKHPMVHESVQLRYIKVRGYRPHALRGTQYVVRGNIKQHSEARQKDPDFEYVVATDNEQVSGVRQGVSGLGVEKTGDTGTTAADGNSVDEVRQGVSELDAE